MAVVVLGSEQETLREKLETIEKQSTKGARKWFHSNRERRERYIRAVINGNLFRESIFYSYYEDSKAYFDLTIFTTAKAILAKAQEPYETTVFVDGLKRPERQRFAAGLRRLNVRVRKVRGVRDESEVFDRLADAVAGFVRDNLEGDETMAQLYRAAEGKGLIERV